MRKDQLTTTVSPLEDALSPDILNQSAREFLAHAAQWLHRVAISTRKTAMCAQLWLQRIAQALLDDRSQLPAVLEECYRFLNQAARRSHPTRERRRRRLDLGFTHASRPKKARKRLPRLQKVA